MGKFIKSGRVVILLSGRYAGRKAVVVKPFDEGTKKERKFPHCLVAGIARNPRKVHKRMSQKKIEKKTKVQPFIKYVNYTHLMPTRYIVTGQIDLKTILTDDKMKTKETREEAKKEIKRVFEEKYKSAGEKDERAAHVQFFFKKLKF